MRENSIPLLKWRWKEVLGKSDSVYYVYEEDDRMIVFFLYARL